MPREYRDVLVNSDFKADGCVRAYHFRVMDQTTLHAAVNPAYGSPHVSCRHHGLSMSWTFGFVSDKRSITATRRSIDVGRQVEGVANVLR